MHVGKLNEYKITVILKKKRKKGKKKEKSVRKLETKLF